jgi:hypothetical protein
MKNEKFVGSRPLWVFITSYLFAWANNGCGYYYYYYNFSFNFVPKCLNFGIIIIILAPPTFRAILIHDKLITTFNFRLMIFQ